MIDLKTETAISLAEAAKLLPGRGGRPCNFSTVWRWILKGARSPDGRLVKLRGMRLGAKWLTSLKAIQEFGAALTPRPTAEPTDRPRTPERRQRAVEKAAAELEAAGV